jgi:hypothetical protein
MIIVIKPSKQIQKRRVPEETAFRFIGMKSYLLVGFATTSNTMVASIEVA